jgi:galactokinase/mevalonate kinase-like predicted kinase
MLIHHHPRTSAADAGAGLEGEGSTIMASDYGIIDIGAEIQQRQGRLHELEREILLLHDTRKRLEDLRVRAIAAVGDRDAAGEYASVRAEASKLEDELRRHGLKLGLGRSFPDRWKIR